MTSPPQAIRVCYRLRARGRDAQALAEQIAYEQTVELPPELVGAELRREVVARVAEVTPDPGDGNFSLAWLDFPAARIDGSVSYLLNLLYGNVSMFGGIRLVDVRWPDSVLAGFDGPAQGMAGVRAQTGVYERPLLATALKPRGIGIARLAEMAGAFAAGGGDIVKDDQNLMEADFKRFTERVSACFDAVAEANARGGHCVYFPHLAGPAEQLGERAAFLQRLGVAGVLACPFVLGLDNARALTRSAGLIYMAHPSLSGAFTASADEGIAHGLLLGTLLRLGGADIAVFPGAGGRFDVDRAHCADITARLRAPLGALKPACPAPAGGVGFDDLDTLGEACGADTTFLIGGALHGYGPNLKTATAAFLDRIRNQFGERIETPRALLSACEVPAPAAALELLDRIPFQPEFEWTGRPSQAYKDSQELPFKGIRRVELVGRGGERTHFELRYFEVAPGGYTSLEKHRHTHVLIGARGAGTVMAGAKELPLNPMDVAYIAPLKVHQLRNAGDQPFGFFCIVDRERDRPMAPD